MRVAVIGANGQLGTDVCAAYAELGHEVTAVTHADLDVADRAGVMRTLRSTLPQLVVNTAAMHNVEACEQHPDAAMAVNATGAHNLALAGRDLGFALAHVSTDYVFDGRKETPYVEDDSAAPVNVYGRTKLRGEQLIADTLAEHYVVRTSGLYGSAPCRAKTTGNFVQMMLRFARERGEVKVVADEMVTPTYTRDLARQMAQLTDAKRYGLYHATSQGETSWYDYARTIFEIAGMNVRMHRASGADFASKAPRPKYSVLDNAALRNLGLDLMPSWRDALERYLATLQ